MQPSILKTLIPKEQLKNIDFLKETCHQINKDLNGLTTIQVQLTEQLLEYPFENLITQMIPIIVDLDNSGSIQTFIYRVDLPETKYLDFKIRNTDSHQFICQIIERSAQKVFLRWHFSNRL
ncbi:MAG: hypothetical protein AB8B74_09180 [Crocinitomicaceae bacterium]